MAQAAARRDAVVLEFPRRPRLPRRVQTAPEPTLADVARLLARVVEAWLRRLATRRRLSQMLRNLPDEALADLGYTRDRAAREVRKPFWRA
jgi:uncharacterized protein YjiS (DUF1127 family)